MSRDEELSDAFLEEELDRWERFLELSPEAALASTNGTQQVFDIAKRVSDMVNWDRKMAWEVSHIKDGTALLLSVLGRGVSQCRLVNFDAMTGPTLKASEAIAFLANLRSNTNIKELGLRAQKIFGKPQMCAVLSDALTRTNTLTSLRMLDVEMTPVALRCLLFGGWSSSSWHPTKLETDLAVLVGKSSEDYGEISNLRNEIKMEVEKVERRGLWAHARVS